MTASEFLSAYADASQRDRENAIATLAANNGLVRWPLVPISVVHKGSKITFFVTADYVAVGDENAYVRVPLSAVAAQRVADILGYSLPTARMVDLIWRAADVKLEPIPLPADKGMVSFRRMVEHDAKIDVALETAGGWFGQLVAGHKKDLVISNRLSAGRVAIYGWHRRTGVPIQTLNTKSHDDLYVDYSHGVRLVSRTCTVNGSTMPLQTVLQDRDLCGALSEEGPLTVFRQPSVVVKADPVGMTLRPGDNGSSVTRLQTLLGVTPDGIFGPKTEAAVRAYQAAHGLTVDGIVGPKTLASLNAATTGEEPSPYPFIQARHFAQGRTAPIWGVVIHTMEYPERDPAAEWCGSFFKDPKTTNINGAIVPVIASAHYAVDRDSIVQCVREQDTAYHAGPVNAWTIGIEHAGYARQTPAEWADAYSQEMLERSARLVAEICVRHNIPAIRLTPEDLKAGRRGGIFGHDDVRVLTGGKGHYDPGPSFVWDWYLGRIRAYLAKTDQR